MTELVPSAKVIGVYTQGVTAQISGTPALAALVVTQP